MAMTAARGRATEIIAGLTALAFLVVQLGGLKSQAAVLAGFIPARVQFFAEQGVNFNVPWLPVWLTPLSATFVHDGWLHLGLNLLIFFFCGRQVEHVIGPVRLLIVYVIGAYVAAAFQWAAMREALEPTIGASGAISAIIGCYAVIYSRNEVSAIGPFSAQVVRIAWLAAAWTILQLMIGFAGLWDNSFGGIAVWAHIGGFIAGLLLARPMLTSRFSARG